MDESAPTGPGTGTRWLVAMSGGGAKGIVHVGALRALEAAGVGRPAALAGTSAGAIVAALVACGFRADELIGPRPGGGTRTIFDLLGVVDPGLKDARGLFGRLGWRRVALARAIGSAPLWASASALAAVVAIVAGTAAAGRPYAALVELGVVLGLVLVAAWSVLGGLAGLARFERALGRLLAARLAGVALDSGADAAALDALPEPCFGDLGPARGRPALKIVAANLSERRLALFSSGNPRDVATPIARAVAASIAIPGVFGSVVLDRGAGPRSFADGGLVSNLPAWAFDEERELDPDLYTLAVDVADRPRRPRALPRRGWLGAALRTAVFGAGELNLRAVARAEKISLAAASGLLDFDAGRDALWAEVARCEAETAAILNGRVFELSRRYRTACAEFARIARAELDGGALLGAKAAGSRVRAAVALPDSAFTRSLRLRHSSGFDGCPDERILLPFEGSLLGFAYTRGKPVIAVAPFPPEIALPGPANRLRRAQVWPEMRWAAAFPVFVKQQTTPAAVVTLDGNDLLTGDPAMLEALTAALEAHVPRLFGNEVVYDRDWDWSRR